MIEATQREKKFYYREKKRKQKEHSHLIKRRRLKNLETKRKHGDAYAYFIAQHIHLHICHKMCQKLLFYRFYSNFMHIICHSEGNILLRIPYSKFTITI